MLLTTLWLLAAVLALILLYILIKNVFGANDRFYDSNIFPALECIEESYDVILKEFDENHKNLEVQWPEKNLYNESKSELWNIIPMYGFGIWNERLGSCFPETMSRIKKIPGLKTAIFSRLGPNTQLKKHQGWQTLSNKVLRCQMGIKIPKNARSGIEVEDVFKQVEIGKFVVFDDSKMHVGVNKSHDEDRVVLILDIKRPWWVQNGKSKVKETAEVHKLIADVKSFGKND